MSELKKNQRFAGMSGAVSRRSIISGLMASVAVVGVIGLAAGEAEDQVWYLTPTGQGDGTDWADAAAIRRFGQIAVQMPRGGQVRVGFPVADEPMQWSGQQMLLAVGGQPDAPLHISFGELGDADSFVQSQTLDDDPILSMLGNDTNADGRPNVGGAPYLVIGEGAGHLQISGPAFHKSGGNGFFNIDAKGPVRDLRFSDIHATRAGRVIEAERETSVEGLLVERCSARGLIRGFARFFELHGAEFRDLDLNADYLDGGGGAVCQIISVVRGADLTFRGVKLARAVNSLAAQERGSTYIQGDGLVLEEETEGVLIEDCHAVEMGDGGFDLKTEGVTLRNCTTMRCKLGIRIWSHNAANLVENCTMSEPVSRPENEGSCLWLAGTLTARESVMNSRADMSPIRFGTGNDDGREASLKIEGGEIYHSDGVTLVTGAPGEVELENVLWNGVETSGRYRWNGRRLRRSWL